MTFGILFLIVSDITWILGRKTLAGLDTRMGIPVSILNHSGVVERSIVHTGMSFRPSSRLEKENRLLN
jgi:hypothetical protein